MPYEQPSKGYPQGNNQFSNDLGVSIREQFFAYNNRHSDDNRSAQVTLGPSEIGSPCDRRIAMSLLGMPAVNPGGDGFAAWLGTQGHRGMADIYEWANGRSGRFAVETRLAFNSRYVPKGTGDLLDRTFGGGTFIDWKFMGTWSLKKLRQSGPSPTYRTQIHTYAYGAIVRGEKVKKVAIVALPRQGATLDEMYVWTEDYDPSVAEAALARVQRIGEVIGSEGFAAGVEAHAGIAQAFATAQDCSWCRFHLKGSSDLNHGCSGPS